MNDCQHTDQWFSRILECCGWMHTYCEQCGACLDPCKEHNPEWDEKRRKSVAEIVEEDEFELKLKLDKLKYQLGVLRTLPPEQEIVDEIERCKFLLGYADER